MRVLLSCCFIIVLAACTPIAPIDDAHQSSSASSVPSASGASSSSEIAFLDEAWTVPIGSGALRITKKPFGLHVTPEDSPVFPERFTGYHTGVDFELSDEEDPSQIVIKAACDGEVIYRDWVSGYGGILVQRCELQERPVTVLYGHLAIDSVSFSAGDFVTSGEEIGRLGEGLTEQTDGERSHLHFAIHRGESLNVRGYVSSELSLKEWVDPIAVFKMIGE